MPSSNEVMTRDPVKQRKGGDGDAFLNLGGSSPPQGTLVRVGTGNAGQEATIETRIILVRHGDSHHKRSGIIAGPKGCRGLTDTGREQARRLADRLRQVEQRPAAIYSSIIPRAVETATIVADALGGPGVVQDCGLCTWHIPAEVDGQSWEDYRRDGTLEGGGVFRPFERGNETWAELVARTGRSLETIAIRHAGELVLLVAHAESVQASLTVFGDLPLSPGFDLAIAPTAITEWTTSGDPAAWPRPRWTLRRLGDNAHIDG